jgi:hypothetical protein
MSTTGATIAWIAVTAIGFISPAYESSAGQNLGLSVSPSGRYAVPVRLTRSGRIGTSKGTVMSC